jgi:hypothetical protein
LIAALVSGCSSNLQSNGLMTKDITSFLSPDMPPPVIRQPVLPELLKGCRGHVLVPALGMKFVPRGAVAPESGQFMREENISAPYRIITPGARVSQEMSPTRLNVELDRWGRIVGLYCG